VEVVGVVMKNRLMGVERLPITLRELAKKGKKAREGGVRWAWKWSAGTW
jgi:hypothetical protein